MSKLVDNSNDNDNETASLTDGSQIMSQLIHFKNYAIFLQDKGRRETYSETVDRNMNMHIRKFPFLESEIRKIYELVQQKKVLPSMRSMQFAGAAIEENNIKLYNCCYLQMDNIAAFWEVMFCLLCGTGVGYSVRKIHIDQIPPINRKNLSNSENPGQAFVIPDTIEGWALGLKELVLHHFQGAPKPIFDFSLIRPAGTLLRKSGGKAPGPEPLKRTLIQLDKMLSSKMNGQKLSAFEIHSFNCQIADCVLSGGIRRSAMLCLFDPDDSEMLFCKTKESLIEGGNAFLYNANNSAAIDPESLQSKVDFDRLWNIIEMNRSGDPAIYFIDSNHGTNPCGEIYLRPMQFCNLTEVNVSNVTDQEDFETRVRAAAFLGTLQASYTSFPFLRKEWSQTTQEDALLGVSMTGIATGKVLDLDLKKAAIGAKEENRRIAKLIGINPARRITTVKPSGTTSLIVENSGAGIHPMHAAFWKRRIQVSKLDPVYHYFRRHYPKAVEDLRSKADTTAVITQGLKAPKGSKLRNENFEEFLDRVAKVSQDWIHFDDDSDRHDYHNISATISLKPTEWHQTGEWIWDHRFSVRGLATFSVFEPTEEDKKAWPQLPNEDCTEEEVDELISYMRGFDVTKIRENTDNTNFRETLACSSDRCEKVNM